jgi:hypothetical protein
MDSAIMTGIGIAGIFYRMSVLNYPMQVMDLSAYQSMFEKCNCGIWGIYFFISKRFCQDMVYLNWITDMFIYEIQKRVRCIYIWRPPIFSDQFSYK